MYLSSYYVHSGNGYTAYLFKISEVRFREGAFHDFWEGSEGFYWWNG